MINKYFSMAELSCHCGCGQAIEDETLIKMITQARQLASIPFQITSWNRCLEYNTKIGSKPTSSHIIGKALDIRFKNNIAKFNIVSALMQVGFVRIGINDKAKFVHCDLDLKKTQRTLFAY